MLFNESMILEGLLAIIIFAFVPLAIKFTTAGPITICLFRLAVAVAVLSIFWRKKIDFNSFFSREAQSWKLWLIGLIFFAHWVAYAYGVKLGGASIGVLGLSTYGLQLILAGVLFLGHRVTKKEIICLTLSLLGVLMIVPSWSLKSENSQGLILSLLSATCFALLPIVHRKSEKFSLETRIFAQFFGAMVGFLFFFSKTEWNLKSIDWWMLIFLALFGTLIAHSLWVKVSMRVSVTKSALAYYAIAPISIILSHFLLSETFTNIQFIGAFIVILAAVMNIIPSRV